MTGLRNRPLASRILRALASALLAGTVLGAQETPSSNRMVWFAVFPEPLPEGVDEVRLEASSQFMRPDLERTEDHRAFARVDGEEWQITTDLARTLGPGRINLRFRVVERCGGMADQAIWNFHNLLGLAQGGRADVPKYRLAYHLERDGVVVGDLGRNGLHLLDTDLAFVVPFGDRAAGGRVGLSLQLPTGRRDDFSGNGGLDGMVGAALWRQAGAWKAHGQAEAVFLDVPHDSPYWAVLRRTWFTRAWAGLGWQGSGSGWRGLGLDLTLAFHGNPYAVGLPRVDRPGWQQHWTFSHRDLPRWRFGFSEDCGTYTNPDVTGFVSCRF